MLRAREIAVAGFGLLLLSSASVSAQVGRQCMPAVANPEMYSNCRIAVTTAGEVCRCGVRPAARTAQPTLRGGDRTSTQSDGFSGGEFGGGGFAGIGGGTGGGIGGGTGGGIGGGTGGGIGGGTGGGIGGGTGGTGNSPGMGSGNSPGMGSGHGHGHAHGHDKDKDKGDKHANNGFGNGPEDGIPGNSEKTGKTDHDR